MRTILLFTFAAGALAQPTAYLRSGGPAGYVITGVSNTTPAVIQTWQPHGLQPGDVVTNWNAAAMVNGSCGASAANGLRKVKEVVDATHFSITDLNGADVAANGDWCDGSRAGYGGGAAGGGKLTPYTLAAQPRVLLDGPNGTWTRKLALGTANGLASLTVAGGVATAVTTYSHGLTTGDKIGVWGSGNAALNNGGNPYAVAVTDDTTFTFAAAGVPDGTYTNSNLACGPSANQDCLRLSQLAYTGNIWWDAVMTRFVTPWSGNNTYQHLFDGGTQGTATSSNANIPQYWAVEGIKFIVDPTDNHARDVALYCVNHIERINGVNWTANENATDGGNINFTDYASNSPMGASLCYTAVRDYLTADQRQTFADKMLNDVKDPGSQCGKTNVLPANEILAADAAQGGSSNTIVLAASDTAADGFYVNNVIQIAAGGSKYYGVVAGYNASTRTATIAGTWGSLPTAGTAYTIYASMVVSTKSSGATATVTGYNTHFTSDVAAGDAVIGGNTWTGGTNGVEGTESYVVSVDSDTQLTVRNAPLVQASTSTPTIVWIAHKWKTGDCGLKWLQSHWAGGIGNPSQYPPDGGYLGAVSAAWAAAHKVKSLGGNNGYTYTLGWSMLDLALADDDPRAVTDLAMINSIWWDYQARFHWNYATGLDHAGANYSFVNVQRGAVLETAVLMRSVPSFPWPDQIDWINGNTMLKIYGVYPDRRYSANTGNNVPWPTRWGAQDPQNPLDNASEQLTAWLLNPSWAFSPQSAQAGFYLSFMKSFCCTYDRASRFDSRYVFGGMLLIDPRIQPSDYTVQPLQYLFQKTSLAACQQTGAPCDPTFRADAVISRSGSWTNKTDTQAYFGARTFWNDHDVPEAGTLRLYKVGHLLTSDTNPPGSAMEIGQTGQTFAETQDTMPLFGGAVSVHTGENGNGIPATANITRWASANHGTWDPAYGDPYSRYAYAMADMTGSYRGPHNRVWRHFAHFKKLNSEEIVAQFDDIDVANAPTPIEVHIHYAQNGETNIDGYNEGNTTCPGGCDALNSSRLIQSFEDGGTTGKDPDRVYGVVTRFLSPGAIFVRDDGSSYPGGNGHTHRVTLCGGNSCGDSVNQFEAMVVHKVASGLSDTNLTAKILPSDPRWAAFETVDADGSGGKVMMFARNGQTPFRADIQTDHPGVGQYLVAGLQPGYVYRVYRNDDGTDVLRQAVTDGDNSLYFEASAGSYSIFPEDLSNLFLRGGMGPPHKGSPFAYAFGPAAGASRWTWTVAAGALPDGLTLSPTGLLSGTPTRAGDFTFAVQGQSSGAMAISATASLALHVGQPELNLTLRGFGSGGAIVQYGRRGLDAMQSCTLTVSRQADFGAVVETAADRGGAARRSYVAGKAAPLEPFTTYYARADCGPESEPATVALTTPGPVAPAEATIPVLARPPAELAARSVRIEYGPTPALGQAVAAPCGDACEAAIPATPGTIVYVRRVYLDAAARVLAASSVAPMAVPR